MDFLVLSCLYDQVQKVFMQRELVLCRGNGRSPFMLETSVPGIFAAGDVRATSTKQVASAAGEGATVALEIREYLKTV